MQIASRSVSPAQREQICRAVAEAEAKTSAEIVPVIASSSGRYDRAEDLVGLWFGAIATIVAWIFWPHHYDEPGSWGGVPEWTQLLVMLASLVIGFLVGAMVASRVDWLRRLFTPRGMMASEVQARARGIFFDTRVHHTQGRNGLLVYVSLLEHRAVILADAVVLEKLGQPKLDVLCQHMVANLRSRGIASALCDTILEAGQLLSPVLPWASNDVNELPDALVLIDGPG